MLSKRREAPAPRGELTPAAAASYIADMLSGMSDVARQHGLASLAQLLDIAHAEAKLASEREGVPVFKVHSAH